MLDLIRQRAQGWIAWVIVILISIPFALWGVNEYFGGGRGAPAAEVDGVSISQEQLQRAYYQERQRLQELMGDEFDLGQFPEEQIRQQVLQKLIRQELLTQAAAENGLRVSDAHLSQSIRSMEAFQGDAGFDPARYQQLLSQQGMQPAYFESQVRRDLVTEQLYRGFVTTDFITERQVDAFLRVQNQQRHIGYLQLPANTFSDEVVVTEDEIAAYYQENPGQFMVPERVKVAYLELNREELASGFEVEESVLRARYEAHEENYRSPEQRRARHLLIAVDSDATEAEVQAAEKKVQEMVTRLEEGASLAELAKEYSDDIGSASDGGDLGFFERGAMVPAFEEAVFAMQEGEVSEPVRSEFGYHLIELETVRESEVEPYSAVRDQIREDVRREQADEYFYDLADRLANLTYEQPDSLEPAAEELGLEIRQTEAFPRQGAEEGVAASREFAEAAFSEDVLSGGNNSQTIELDSGSLVVLRVREHFPATKKPLDEVGEDIRSLLREQQMAALAAEKAASLVEHINAGEAPSEVAEVVGQEWQEIAALERDASEPDRSIIAAAFAMPRPGGDTPTARAVTLDSGDQAVIALYGVESGQTEVGEAQRQQARQALRQAASEHIYSGLVEALQKRADITRPQ
ncbi:SurA N-terminal domain-containing protein [Thiohalomonas denitrificans]|uniref:Periplasmic chaperone PpiD n=1 Tax=Thiohalomonas denitrificans TaxID=415747 RepID=A0A1G5QPV0_9GAMM|nr:SurA N-terminal domain-containing protein [Thiohalomonas denitrificans]SCZ63608.1 peptidyl-prolyl cis-trans isomerase D [Thiohalomonas denitrificans]